jgi:hypothetical protein
MQADEIFVMVLVLLFAGAIAAAAIDSRRRARQVAANAVDGAPDVDSDVVTEASEVSSRGGDVAGQPRGSRRRQNRKR